MEGVEGVEDMEGKNQNEKIENEETKISFFDFCKRFIPPTSSTSSTFFIAIRIKQPKSHLLKKCQFHVRIL